MIIGDAFPEGLMQVVVGLHVDYVLGPLLFLLDLFLNFFYTRFHNGRMICGMNS